MDIDREEVEDAVRFYDGQGGPLAQCLVDAAKAWLEMGWRPIETAPKGKWPECMPFLGAIYWDDTGEWEILRMEWNEDFGRFGDATEEPDIERGKQPRLWMPLPAPPSSPLPLLP